MGERIINFDNKKIKISDFYKSTKIFDIDEIDVNKILVSKKKPYGAKGAFKYSIGYNDNDVIRPLYLSLPEMNGYVKKFKDKKSKITTTTMSLIVKDKQLFKKYNKIWKKIERLMRTNFNSKRFYCSDNNI